MKSAILLVLLTPTIAYPANVFLGASLGRTSTNKEVHGSFIGAGQIGLENRHIGTSVHWAHLEAASKDESFDRGKLTLTPVIFNLYGRIPIRKGLKAHAGGGIHYMMGEFEQDYRDARYNNNIQEKVTDHIEPGVGFNIMAGFEYRISKRVTLDLDVFSLFFETRYKRQTKRERILTNNIKTEETNVDLGLWAGLLSIKYHFK